MNQFRTLCILVALAVAVIAVEEQEEELLVDNSRIEMYSPMCAFERHGTLLADPFDCSQFIQCDYGNAVVKKCSGGLQYDSRLRVCNWDHLVECGTTNPGIEPHEGPVRCFGYDTLHFLADTTSCEKYYICANGIPYPHQCAPGIKWDFLNNQCDYPEKVTCVGKGDNNVPDATSAVTERVTEAPPTDAPTTAAVVVTEPVEEIPDCSTGRSFYGCKDSCEEYFACVGNVAYRMKCPQGYFWNDDAMQCVVPEMARCNNPRP